jgi:hypothetical protein
MATEPQEVFGAGTCRLHLHVEMKLAHGSKCWPRQHSKMEKLPRTEVVGLLTNRGIIRVRPLDLPNLARQFLLPGLLG